MLILMLQIASAETIANSKVLHNLKDLVEWTHFEDIRPLASTSMPIPLQLGKSVNRQAVLDALRQHLPVEKPHTN